MYVTCQQLRYNEVEKATLNFYNETKDLYLFKHRKDDPKMVGV